MCKKQKLSSIIFSSLVSFYSRARKEIIKINERIHVKSDLWVSAHLGCAPDS